MEFVGAVKASGLVIEVIVDGSFVTDNPHPNDIDIVLLVSATHDFTTEMRPSNYNILSKRNVRRRFGFDIVLARAGTDDVLQAAGFFQQIRGRPDLRKGILRVRL
jgi:hypothetical protein